MLRAALRYWQGLTLGQEITVILVVKLLAIVLIWALFFKGRQVEVTPDRVLEAATLQAAPAEKK